MNGFDGPFADNIAEKARVDLVPRSLSIAVLGPSTSNAERNPGGEKRQQILDALIADGHRPFFPEDFVEPGHRVLSLLEQEQLLLDSPGVDLVIILHTATSAGVLQEIGYFTNYPSIMAKTAILYPARFYKPGENLPTDTASRYLVRTLYTNRLFRECSLVSECRSWANAMAIGRWRPLQTNRF